MLNDDGYPSDDPPKVASWSYQFRHPVEKVWPLLSNTDRINRAIGVPPVAYTDTPRPEGGSERVGVFRVVGFKLEWQEAPYEWVAPVFLRSERDYLSGPMKRMYIHWRLVPDGDTCRVEQSVNYETGGFVYDLIASNEVGRKTRAGFLGAFAHIDRYLDAQEEKPFPPRPNDGIVASAAALSHTAERLAAAGITTELAEALARYALTASPLDIARVRPFVLAREWGKDKREVLGALMKATHAGIFDVAWDLICPSCQGDKASSGSLAGLEAEAHCDSCNITYDADFDRSVEVTFKVNPSIRSVNVGRYCIGGPQNTPHLEAQLRLQPDQRRSAELDLVAGTYTLRSLQSKARYELEVIAGATRRGEIAFSLVADAPEPQNLSLAPGRVRFDLHNALPHEALALLERQAWRDDACTGVYVTTLQEFRDLFSTEVLRPGQELSIQSITLMFTDLKGSTAMYNEVGDATAFSRVRDHFDILTDCVAEHEGGIVKTIGDAIMAAFTNAAQAAEAAIEIHRRFHAHNLDHPEVPLTLKIGLHTGPCFAVTLNERLDYFGSTVNIAARVEGQCAGDDIVMSERTHREPGVGELLASSGCPVEVVTRELKGFAGSFDLCQVDCAKL